jgi:hypothetical protein
MKPEEIELTPQAVRDWLQQEIDAKRERFFRPTKCLECLVAQYVNDKAGRADIQVGLQHIVYTGIGEQHTLYFGDSLTELIELFDTHTPMQGVDILGAMDIVKRFFFPRR